ncbi:cobalamin biosynthesis protein [Saccharothrix longispora]|uniref:cobalamin biosynthesis protein n=1 Tax=Saccharothrix longispora TaxID=33920 RepID=UPI0028FD14DD|nr:cobalamin biosynthesis protein [Saccharothrix longispora]MDU0291282.1 cobalamin biosynthesis protein [Saccharothrix longispora]
MSLGRAVGLLLGVAADAVFGDPEGYHPVAGFGRAAKALERTLYRDARAAGAAHTAALVGGTVLAGVAVERLAGRNEVVRALTTAVATWAVLGGSSLADEGTAMGRELDGGDLEAARRRLPNLCGREPHRLDTLGLAKATVESVAENTSDAVVAPLFWGAVAGVPGLIGYRAVNTLDAMVGHRDERYRRFGWAAARLDDVANLLPSRLAALLTAAGAPVVGGSAGEAWRTWRRDASAHPSPNAGQVEAAFAGALEIRLGGRTVYAHGAEDRPVLGHGRSPDAGHVTRAVELSRVVGAAAAGVTAVIALVRPRPRPRRASRRRTSA